MAETYDLILKGGTVVNQDGEGAARPRHPRRPLCRHRRPSLALRPAEVIDCRGLHLLPGVIDSHVHFREPGLTHKEDLESGSRGAVLGGVTAVFEMPNTDPTTTTAAAIADKVKRGHHRMHCDFAFYVGATRENTKDLGELEMLPGVCRRQGVHGLLHRLAADRGRRRRARGAQERSAAAPPSIPRTSIGCASG